MKFSTIVLENGNSIKLDVKIQQFKEFKNFIILLTDPTEKGKINNENVYSYDLDGKQLWQIENLNLFHKNHYYTSIYFQDSKFYLYNLCGVEVKINPETGEVLSKELIK